MSFENDKNAVEMKTFQFQTNQNNYANLVNEEDDEQLQYQPNVFQTNNNNNKNNNNQNNSIYKGNNTNPITSQIIVNLPESNENACCLGFFLGLFFSIFGLLCICCVKDRAGYLKGWIIPFIISLVLSVVLITLGLVGIIDIIAFFQELFNINQN
eukprot:TRINITY_DN313_c0_g6_i1.p1 TRINITY_DN313_c0_g6~~TRINITY_DN313_c0_g6_i1.p1  ORF type:complete len:172 (+),score=62.80 TRINITY_DN313_c0_g6_i1:52-516(+)